VIRNPQAILFDLDGTLVDSVPDLAFSVNAMLEKLGNATVEEDTVRHWVGNGAERLVKRALTGEMEAEPDAELFERAYPLFLDFYSDHVMVDSRLFPRVDQGLRLLRAAGYPMGCITNKPERFTTPLLAALGIDRYFSIQVSGDTLPYKKPDPRPLRYAAEFFKVPAEYMLMVGDSRNDVQAARAAGAQIVSVPYGYNHGEDIRAERPDAVIEDLTQLVELIKQAA